MKEETFKSYKDDVAATPYRNELEQGEGIVFNKSFPVNPIVTVALGYS
jgi:hypothetical protein